MITKTGASNYIEEPSTAKEWILANAQINGAFNQVIPLKFILEFLREISEQTK